MGEKDLGAQGPTLGGLCRAEIRGENKREKVRGEGQRNKENELDESGCYKKITNHKTLANA